MMENNVSETIDTEKRDLKIEIQILKQRITNHYWFSSGLLFACILLLIYW